MMQDMRKQQINVALTQSSNVTACGSKHTRWSYSKSIPFGAYKATINWIQSQLHTLCKSPVNALAKRVGMTMISAL